MRQRRPNQPALLLVGLAAAACFGGWLDHQVHAHTAHRFEVPPPARFELTNTHTTWHGQPVYCLTNRWSAPLKHIALTSWSEQFVPLLFVGNHPPAQLADVHPNVHPPVTLEPGESVWFAGSHRSPYKLTVMWLAHGEDDYQVYQIRP